MAPPPTKTDELAAEAFAHFLTGMMKADGVVSLAEEEKVADLLYKYRKSLPAEGAPIVYHVQAIKNDLTRVYWTAHQHLDAGFKAFDEFVMSGGERLSYVLVLREMMHMLMEVDGIDEEEATFMKKMEAEVVYRYNNYW